MYYTYRTCQSLAWNRCLFRVSYYNTNPKYILIVQSYWQNNANNLLIKSGHWRRYSSITSSVQRNERKANISLLIFYKINRNVNVQQIRCINTNSHTNNKLPRGMVHTHCSHRFRCHEAQSKGQYTLWECYPGSNRGSATWKNLKKSLKRFENQYAWFLLVWQFEKSEGEIGIIPTLTI